MSQVVYVGGVDLSTLGFRSTAIPGWRDGVRRSFALTQVPGGFNLPAPLATVEPRVLRITGLLGDDNDTWGERATKLDTLVAAIGWADTLIHFGDVTTRKVTGRLIAPQAAPIAPTMEKATGIPWRVTLEFWCPDPRYIAATASTVTAIGSTPKAIPAGTAEMDWTLVLSGGTNPVVTFRNGADASVYTMGFTAVNTGQTITIKGGRTQSLATTINLSGASPYTIWTSPTPPVFPRLHPDYWSAYTSAWMDVAVTGGGTGALTYYRAWG